MQTDQHLKRELKYIKLYCGPFITPQEVNNLSNQTAAN